MQATVDVGSYKARKQIAEGNGMIDNFGTPYRYWGTLPAFINHISAVSQTETYNGATVVCLADSTSSLGGNGTYADPLANLALANGASSFASVSIGALVGALLLGVLLL